MGDPYRAEHAGRSYHFCSATCRTKFVADPARYVSKAGSATTAPVASGTIYTCPMHQQVRQVGPAIARSAAWRTHSSTDSGDASLKPAYC